MFEVVVKFVVIVVSMVTEEQNLHRVMHAGIYDARGIFFKNVNTVHRLFLKK